LRPFPLLSLRPPQEDGQRDWANEMPDALLSSIFDIIITAPTAHPSYLVRAKECMGGGCSFHMDALACLLTVLMCVNNIFCAVYNFHGEPSFALRPLCLS